MNVGNTFDGTVWLGKVTAGVSSLAPWTEHSRLGLYIFQLMLFFRQSLRGIRLPCISRSKAYRQDLRLNAASKKIWEQMRWAWISEDSCSLERLIIYLSKLIDFLRVYAAACSIFMSLIFITFDQFCSALCLCQLQNTQTFPPLEGTGEPREHFRLTLFSTCI